MTLNGDDIVAAVAASTPGIDEAIQRGRDVMKERFNITRIPRSHLHALAEAMLEGHLDTTQARTLMDAAVAQEHQRVQAEAAASEEKLRTEHANALIDVDERIAEASAEGIATGLERGKKQLRVKHQRLTEAVAAVAEARELVKACVAWSGRESWRDDALARLDELHASLDPNDIH